MAVVTGDNWPMMIESHFSQPVDSAAHVAR